MEPVPPSEPPKRPLITSPQEFMTQVVQPLLAATAGYPDLYDETYIESYNIEFVPFLHTLISEFNLPDIHELSLPEAARKGLSSALKQWAFVAHEHTVSPGNLAGNKHNWWNSRRIRHADDLHLQRIHGTDTLILSHTATFRSKQNHARLLNSQRTGKIWATQHPAKRF